MAYEHTQRGGMHVILVAFAAAFAGGAWLGRGEPPVPILLGSLAVVFVLLAGMFATLTVRDEGDALLLQYGPLPVFRKRIRYADVTAVEAGRTSVLDGWGIHWIPFRGTTYNLWGFGCVKLTLGRRTIRVGTDDVEVLTQLLLGRIVEAALERQGQ